MPFREGQPTLIGFMGIPIVTKAAKTRFIGGPYMRFYNLFEVISYLYMSGAILGRARRNKFSILAKILVVPGTDVNEFIEFLQEEAKNRLEQFVNEVGKEPNTFFEFILIKELEKAGINIGDSFEAYMHGDKSVIKAADEKVPLQAAEPIIKKFQLEGIGFGSAFPELTEKLYRNTFEKVDRDSWVEARKYGLAISEEPTIISLEEQEEIVLQMVAGYASEYYPELLDTLDLRQYLEQ